MRAADPKKSLVAPQKHGFRRQEPGGRGTWARSYPADQVSGRSHVSFGFDCQAHEVTSWLTDGSLDELAMKQGRWLPNPGSMWEMSQREAASRSSELALDIVLSPSGSTKSVTVGDGWVFDPQLEKATLALARRENLHLHKTTYHLRFVRASIYILRYLFYLDPHSG